MELNWYEESESDRSPIISSRVRLARNLKGYNFPVLLDSEKTNKMIETVRTSLSDFSFINPAEEVQVIRQSMVERHEISPDMLKTSLDRSFAVLKGFSNTSVLLGEEDHIRIQAITSGNNLDKAYEKANEVDDKLDNALEYDYHNEFGYLTSCPTNTGTGLRASFMIHIPMLEKTGNLQGVINSLSKLGMTLRGIYGEGSKPIGSIYQVSNQVTLGKSELEILEEIKAVGSQLVESEQNLLKSAFTKDPLGMEDIIYRALGLLGSARKISIYDAMESLSAIRVGILSGVLKQDIARSPIYAIMMNTHSGSLQSMMEKNLSENDILIYRAKYLRETFQK
jgi:protein arginine kinase